MQQASTGENPNISEVENYTEEDVAEPTSGTAGQNTPQPVSEQVNAPQPVRAYSMSAGTASLCLSMNRITALRGKSLVGTYVAASGGNPYH